MNEMKIYSAGVPITNFATFPVNDTFVVNVAELRGDHGVKC